MKFKKKILAMVFVLVFVIIGCNPVKSTDSNTGQGQKENINEKIYKIGISQIAEHMALDDVSKGFKEELENLGIKVKYVEQNAQGDVANANLIAQKFVSDEVDLIFAIGTPSAQSAKTATSDIPVIFSAVTDPVSAQLVNHTRYINPNFPDRAGQDILIEDKNITGTTDVSPIKKQLELFKAIDPSIKTVGIVFNTGEVNSQVQVNEATEIGKNIGIEIVSAGISTVSEMPQAVDSLIGKVDGIYTITDNLVANAITVVADKAKANGIVTVGAEEAHVKSGILVTDGISYFNLGKQSADMAKKVLVDGIDIGIIDVESSKTTKKIINADTLKVLGLNEKSPAFEGGEIIQKEGAN